MPKPTFCSAQYTRNKAKDPKPRRFITRRWKLRGIPSSYKARIAVQLNALKQ
jgi:hypothetical protein